MNTTKADLVLAISGGHTQSTAILIKERSEILGVVAGERINLHTDHEATARNNFLGLIAALESTTGINGVVGQCSRVGLVCAGAAFEDDQQRIARMIADPYKTVLDGRRIVVADDTWAGLLAGTFNLKGTCAIAGTGASVFVGEGRYPKGWEAKIDGWGPIIGDFGSGFQLAVNFFRQLGRTEEREQAVPAMFRELADFINQNAGIMRPFKSKLESFDDAQQWFDRLVDLEPRAWRIALASTAAVVTIAADRNNPDPMAVQLVIEAAKDMAESVALALERYPAARSCPIVMQGGMFEHSGLYRQTVKRQVEKTTQNRVLMARYKPIVGAALFALFCDGDKAPELSEKETEIIHQMLKLYSEPNRRLVCNLLSEAELCPIPHRT